MAYRKDYFFEFSQDLMCIIESGYFKKLNPRWSALLGYTDEELLSQPFLEFVHPHDRDQTLKETERLVAGATTLMFQNRYLCKDGSFRHLLWSAAGSDGLVYGIAKDISGIVAQQKSLLHYKEIIDKSAEAIIRVDTRYQVSMWNPAAEKVFGYTSGEAIGKDLRDLILPPDFPPSDILTMRALRDGKTVSKRQTKRSRRDGTDVHVSITVTPMRDSHDVLVGASFMAHDLTDQMKARETAKSTSNMAHLGFVAAGIGHEVKNPVQVIHYKTHQIRKRLSRPDFDRDSLVDDIEKIKATADRIDRIVSGLSKCARSGENDPFRPESLKNIVDLTVELCAPKIRGSRVEMRIDEIDPNILVECREVQMSQVLLNLLSNAIDAIEGKEVRWIHLSVQDDDDMIHIEVTDSGHGIDREKRTKIMQLFFSTKEVGKGTGLGLALSKSIIEEHQGQLHYDATCPNTRFVISLWKKIPQKTKRAPRILICDDEAELVEMLAFELRKRGFEIVESTHPDEALDAITDQDFDFLILDIRLQKWDGFQLFDKIRADLDHSPKAIFISGHADDRHRAIAQEMGALKLLEKPFDQDQLIQILRSEEGTA